MGLRGTIREENESPGQVCVCVAAIVCVHANIQCDLYTFIQMCKRIFIYI